MNYFVFIFLCSTICPDFFKGGEPWKSSNDISKLNEWLKERDPKNIDR